MLVLVASAPASAADTVVAQLQRPTTIRSYRDVQVFSAFEGGVYRLAIRRGGQVELLPVAPSRAPFDVDIGPDTQGRPQLIYTRCKVEVPNSEMGTNDNTGCDLFLFSPVGARTERPVRGANTKANEFAPTLWKGRIAFARKVKARDRPVVYTRALAAPRSRPAEPLPGIPRRTRGVRTTDSGVAELELSGDHLAQIVSFRAEGRLSEVRLVDVSDRSARRLARVGVGEGGQFFAGVGFAAGHLAWAFDWVGGGGPMAPGIYRYRLSTREVSRAGFPRIVDRQVVGLALFAADGAYMTDSRLEDGGCFDVEVVHPCQLIRSTPLSFRPVRRR
ncbi:MAG TPA: hypothetical protein VES79_03110 [Solirubrobacteraceae bacterium]|nr:hypothetical protein [Solirubrobacteraceae bacterium]